MDQVEIKEFCAQEFDLLKRLQQYGKALSRGDGMGRIEKVMILLIHRIYSNLYSSFLLKVSALKKGRILTFQLPIGLLLRCSFTDCLFALYLLNVEEKRAIEELDLRRIGYANSLLERREVYRDQVKKVGLEFGDDLTDNMWEMTLEDSFMDSLTFDKEKDGLELVKRTGKELQGDGFAKTRSIGIKEQYEYLITLDGLKTVATKMYQYYKYFSQFEHFSENGQGDIFAIEQEDGNDNIHLPSAISALSAGLEEVFKSFGGEGGICCLTARS